MFGEPTFVKLGYTTLECFVIEREKGKCRFNKVSFVKGWFGVPETLLHCSDTEFIVWAGTLIVDFTYRQIYVAHSAW